MRDYLRASELCATQPEHQLNTTVCRMLATATATVQFALLFAALHQGPPLYLLLTALANSRLFGLSSRQLPGFAAHWLMSAGHFVLFTYPR